MEELWWAEAGRNNAFPLVLSPQATVEAALQKPSLTRGRSHFVYREGTVTFAEIEAQCRAGRGRDRGHRISPDEQRIAADRLDPRGH